MRFEQKATKETEVKGILCSLRLLLWNFNLGL
jgi:hypothetical protein